MKSGACFCRHVALNGEIGALMPTERFQIVCYWSSDHLIETAMRVRAIEQSWKQNNRIAAPPSGLKLTRSVLDATRPSPRSTRHVYLESSPRLSV
jgi:hypothetical protein